ncbi:MAG: GFA family protein [Pacificimonas sp.]
MLTGSCCCGAVAFALEDAPSMMATCHCTRCRKVGASIFVFASRDSFRLTSGADSIRTYAPEAGYRYARSFCGICGSALGEIESTDDSFPLPANLFDTPLPLENRFHEFVAEKPNWYAICDSAKQFDHHPQKAAD